MLNVVKSPTRGRPSSRRRGTSSDDPVGPAARDPPLTTTLASTSALSLFFFFSFSPSALSSDGPTGSDGTSPLSASASASASASVSSSSSSRLVVVAVVVADRIDDAWPPVEDCDDFRRRIMGLRRLDDAVLTTNVVRFRLGPSAALDGGVGGSPSGDGTFGRLDPVGVPAAAISRPVTARPSLPSSLPRDRFFKIGGRAAAGGGGGGGGDDDDDADAVNGGGGFSTDPLVGSGA